MARERCSQVGKAAGVRFMPGGLRSTSILGEETGPELMGELRNGRLTRCEGSRLL
jgi:hypothetical protein